MVPVLLVSINDKFDNISLNALVSILLVFEETTAVLEIIEFLTKQ